LRSGKGQILFYLHHLLEYKLFLFLYITLVLRMLGDFNTRSA
jgi:hypothetical protein